MAIAEVPSSKSDDLRRVLRATALLLTGAAVHLWLFPFPGVPGHPFLDRVAAGVASVATEGAVPTAGREPAVTASALGTVPSPGMRSRATRAVARDRVKVLVQTVHPALATSPIQAQPLGPATELLATALHRESPRHQSLQVADHPAPDGRTGFPSIADSSVAPSVEPEPPAPDSADAVGVVVPAIAHAAASLHREAPGHGDAPSEERQVSNVLQQYRHAYENLDVSAAQTVWPTVDARALGAAFRQLAGQRVTFESCGVSVSGSGAQATARCTGQAEYVPKVGGRRAYTASGEWVFDLEKENAAWRITNANANIK